MHAQMECWILTSKNSAKLKQYYFHAEFLEEVRYYVYAPSLWAVCTTLLADVELVDGTTGGGEGSDAPGLAIMSTVNSLCGSLAPSTSMWHSRSGMFARSPVNLALKWQWGMSLLSGLKESTSSFNIYIVSQQVVKKEYHSSLISTHHRRKEWHHLPCFNYVLNLKFQFLWLKPHRKWMKSGLGIREALYHSL